MQEIEYEDPNNNVQFLINKLLDIQKDIHKYIDNNIWLVSDLDLIPRYRGDYSGTGEDNEEGLSYQFYLKVIEESTILVSFEELVTILEDTQTVNNAVIMCFKSDIELDIESFRPKVESNTLCQISHEKALYEIRILDGDLFYIFSNLIKN